jgi:hypothetical protein
VIKNEEGRELKDIKDISKAFEGFYQKLFTTGPTHGVDDCLANLEKCVIEDMNAALLKPFVAEEVDLALGQMYPLKSPGPDGFLACFYQRSWDTVKKEVCKSILDFLNHDIFYPSINRTYIALIPKIKSPKFLTDYRPNSVMRFTSFALRCSPID